MQATPDDVVALADFNVFPGPARSDLLLILTLSPPDCYSDAIHTIHSIYILSHLSQLRDLNSALGVVRDYNTLGGVWDSLIQGYENSASNHVDGSKDTRAGCGTY